MSADPSVAEAVEALRSLRATAQAHLFDLKAKIEQAALDGVTLRWTPREHEEVSRQVATLAIMEEAAPDVMARRSRPPGMVEVVFSEEELRALLSRPYDSAKHWKAMEKIHLALKSLEPERPYEKPEEEP